MADRELDLDDDRSKRSFDEAEARRKAQEWQEYQASKRDYELGAMHRYLAPFPSLGDAWLKHVGPRPGDERQFDKPHVVVPANTYEGALRAERAVAPFMGVGFQTGVGMADYMQKHGRQPSTIERNTVGGSMPDKKTQKVRPASTPEKEPERKPVGDGGVTSVPRPNYQSLPNAGGSAPRKVGDFAPRTAEGSGVKTIVVLQPGQYPNKGIGGSDVPPPRPEDYRPRVKVESHDPNIVDTYPVAQNVRDNYAHEAYVDKTAQAAAAKEMSMPRPKPVNIPPRKTDSPNALAPQFGVAALGGVPLAVIMAALNAKARSEGR